MLGKSFRLVIASLAVASVLAPGVASAKPVLPSPTPPAPTLDKPAGGEGLHGPTNVPRATTGGTTSQVAMKLERDGRLSVVERIHTKPGRTLHRTVPLRFSTGERSDRIFRVSRLEFEGDGKVQANGDTFEATVTGEAKISYVVHGAVVAAGDHEEVSWQPFSDWDTAFDSAQVSLASPKPPLRVDCVSGPADSAKPCADVSRSVTGFVTVSQQRLEAGDRLSLGARLPANTVPANVITATSSAFALNWTTGIWLIGLTAVLLLAVVLLWFTRGRDARVRAHEVNPVKPIAVDERGSACFASPDGVLPGQVGTVIDQRVDGIDVTATLLDFAVRDYLWIVELGAGERADWWIVRRNPADDSLTEYERALYEAVLGNADGVLASELAAKPPELARVRSAMYADVTGKGWFARRPDSERRRWRDTGLALAGIGVLATVVLALTIGNALIGLGVVLGGAALAIAARWMPARTKRGSALVQQITGLQRYLAETDPSTLPAADRELVFSRSLPYAVVLGQAQRWLAAFEHIDTSADGDEGLYWFATAEQRASQQHGGAATMTVRDLRAFAERFPAFVYSLDTVFAKVSRQ